jgi:hypothetical protein
MKYTNLHPPPGFHLYIIQDASLNKKAAALATSPAAITVPASGCLSFMKATMDSFSDALALIFVKANPGDEGH